ncbi:MarR family winged helix-turn-helix transcriptional regulator [Ammonifex thiophilus]|uniref:MarR family transcriptional regulator n=1 Tax=Ammonifex thiophilus TaxID=444093 RepID=A0A3D8P717_9THEO|nr:MarR family transcriptional regulator [Ammonifex thiophilus]RDV84497.1 MarR family transcriptional regulator [Ammonifex thiophilus]
MEELQRKMEKLMRLMIRRLASAAALGSETRRGLPLLAVVAGGPYFFLQVLAEKGRASVSEMAAELGVTLAAITALAGKLSRAGWVQRTRSGPDRRVVWLELTPAGREVLAKARAMRQEVWQSYFGVLSAEEKDLFDRLITKVLRMAEQGGER